MTWHRHIFGCKGLAPHRGDLCLTCPTGWTARAGGYLADGYKPRTERPTPGRAVTVMAEEAE